MTPTIIYIILGTLIVSVFILAVYEYKDKKKTIESFKKTLTDLETLRLSNIDQMKTSNCANIKEYEERVADLQESHKQEIQNIYASQNEELEELRDLHILSIEKMSKDYVQTIEDQNESLALYEKHILNLDITIQRMDKLIHDLDVRGSFEADDEIGEYFKLVKELQEILNNFKLEKEEQDEAIVK